MTTIALAHDPHNAYNSNGKAEALLDEQERLCNVVGLRALSRFVFFVTVAMSVLLAWAFSGAVARKLDCSDLFATLILAFLHLVLAICTYFAFKTHGKKVPVAGVVLCVGGLAATMLWRVHIQVEDDGTPAAQAWLFALLIFFIEVMVPSTLAGLQWYVDTLREAAEEKIRFYRDFTRNIITSTEPLTSWQRAIDSLRASILRERATVGLHGSRSYERALGAAAIARDEQYLDQLEKWYPGPRASDNITTLPAVKSAVYAV